MTELELLTSINDQLLLLVPAIDTLLSTAGFIGGVLIALIVAATWKG